MIDELDYELPRYYAKLQGLHYVVMNRETGNPVLGNRCQPVSYLSQRDADTHAERLNADPR